MTGRFVLSPRAETDLDEIWDYTADRWGLDQAVTYTRDIWQRIQAVAARPAMGQECSNIRTGYYKISCGSHVLFYRLTPEGVDVVRILHARMDYDSHFL
jgi:toxin ParE1/3/4